MLDEAGRFGLVFNGEIYNYLELREALLRDNVRFRTTSDTEVLLKLLSRDGADCVRVLRGMFAFAAWDDSSGALTLARDPIGKKPLYYVVERNCLYFSSSLSALRESSAREWEIDPDALELYLSLGYIPAPLTIYRDVRKLPAATLARLDGGELVLERFWDLAADIAPFDGSYRSALDRLEELLDTAVRLRLRSDVPLGVFLSGGIDSSLVTAVAAKNGGRIQTFSIGFQEGGFDESEYAASIAGHLGTEHRLFRVRTELLDLLPAMQWHYGEPFADSSALPTWTLAQHTRRHVTVALGGDGGDEGFGGYRWYKTADRLSSLARLIPAQVARLGRRTLEAARGLGGLARPLGRLERGLGVLSLRSEAQRFGALRSFMDDELAGQLYAGELLARRRAGGDLGAALVSAAFERADGSPLRRMRHADVCTYLADDLMTKVDVASMAHGLEARAPLLDRDVLRFALSLPDNYLMDERGGKRILRDLLSRYVPRGLFERPKQGFSVPLQDWFAGQLRGRMERLAASEDLRSFGMLRPEGITRLLDEHAAGMRDHSQRLFSILVLDEWLKANNAPGTMAEEPLKPAVGRG